MGGERSAAFYWPFPFRRKGGTLPAFQWPQRFGLLRLWHLNLIGARMVKRKQWINCVSPPQCFLSCPLLRPCPNSEYDPNTLPHMKQRCHYFQLSYSSLHPANLRVLRIGFCHTSCSLMDNTTPMDCNHSVTCLLSYQVTTKSGIAKRKWHAA